MTIDRQCIEPTKATLAIMAGADSVEQAVDILFWFLKGNRRPKAVEIDGYRVERTPGWIGIA